MRLSSVTAYPAKVGSKPADVTESVVDVDVDVDETTAIEGGSGADDLPDVQVGEIAAGVEELVGPGGPGAEDFVWDDAESGALRQARKDAELTVSVDPVRAYLKQIGKVALLNAEQEVELAKRIEAGIYAAERLHRSEDGTDQLAHNCAGICGGSPATARAPETICWRLTFVWSCRWPSATPAAACHSWI